MLSRGGASTGAVGSTNAVWGAKRATAPSSRESKHLSSRTSSARDSRRVEPTLARIVEEIVSLTAPIAKDKIGSDEVLRRDAARIADSKRRIEHGRVDGPPQVDDGDAATKQFVGLVGILRAKTRHAGRRRLIDMNAIRGLAGNAGLG